MITFSARPSAAAAFAVAAWIGLLAPAAGLAQQESTAGGPTEEDYYRLETVPIPEDIVLEVGGLATLPDGRIAAATRRGEIWIIGNLDGAGGSAPTFTRFAHGLHEPLGLAYRDGAFYAAQRSELTRLRDTDGDDRADVYETVVSWPLSANYHEYSYGPVFAPNGDMILTLNLGWVGRGASLAPWRGWAVRVTEDGTLTPFATGMRSPAGFGFNLEGDLFYAENQGDWVGSGFIAHVEEGDFLGSPEGLRWADQPESPISLRLEDVPDTGEPKHVVAQRLPGLKLPAVWFPHGTLGISTSGILVDSTGGRFGPFAGQLFVGDQGHSKVFRVFLERVDGVYQGVVFPFREGFSSGVLRLNWGMDATMYVGMTNRGWSSTGRAPFGLQRLVWTGRVPFEPLRVEARPDGFEITFTEPVDRAAAGDPASYGVTGFTYHYWSTYGSPAIEQMEHPVRSATVSADGRSVRLVVDGLRQGFVHEIRMAGVRSAAGQPLLHDVGYYTLNRIPGGAPAAVAAAPAATTTGQPGAQTGAQPGTAIAKRQTTMPAAWNGQVDQSFTISTQPGLRFSVDQLQVRAGARVALTFVNDDDMEHNLVVTLPGMATAVGQAAIQLGIGGAGQNWVPDSNDVLHHTRILKPGESETIYFVAPAQPGDYDYVCTYPGHYIQMRGVLRVTGGE